MNQLMTEHREILLHVHQSQHEESLHHRQSIFNAFSLSMAGLTAVAAGVIAAGKMSVCFRWAVGTLVVVVCLSSILFMRQQRLESDKAMAILRKIEVSLGLYEKGKYIPEESVLPEEFGQPLDLRMGLSKGERYEACAMALLSFSIIMLLILDS